MEQKQEVLSKMPTPSEHPQVELIREGAAIVRLENNTQMQIAVQRPRDEAKILGDSLRELDLYPSMAEEVMYSKPVGKDENGKMKYAEGLSVRTAESLANRWTNSAFGCDIESEDDQGVTLAAVFLDYENNTRHVLKKKVSRFYKAKDGKKVAHPPDRFADVVIPANQSKLLREVILRSLPAGLKKEYEEKARMILASGDTKKRENKLLTSFMRLGIGKPKIEELSGKKIADFTPDDFTDFLGIYNALRDGETSMDQLIIEKTNAEKMEERLKKPTTPSSEPVNATSEGLTGMRLDLYNRIAQECDGDVFRMDAMMKSLSGCKINNRAELIASPDNDVLVVIDKLAKKK